MVPGRSLQNFPTVSAQSLPCSRSLDYVNRVHYVSVVNDYAKTQFSKSIQAPDMSDAMELSSVVSVVRVRVIFLKERESNKQKRCEKRV